MADCRNQIRGLTNGRTVRVHVSGRAVAHHCPALREFAVRAIANGAREVRIELQDCEYGDSTFMGTLLQIRKAACAIKDDALQLVSPSEQFREALQRMGLLRMFQVSESVPPADGEDWRELAEEPSGTQSPLFQENVVTAHKELSSCSDDLAARYRFLIEDAASNRNL